MKPAIFVAIAFAAVATTASSHSKSTGTTPENAAVVGAVEVIEIRFDHPMRVTAVSLTGPDGKVDLDRETGFDPVAKFRALPSERLPVGNYNVDWRGLAADGHPMQGTFSFTVAD
jgi:methionine-rich copper-binding protein CopC